MKVIFVGIHNKPGLTPLCSSTKTGKIIDQVIALLPNETKAIKTNLFDANFIPDDSILRASHIRNWLIRSQADFNDIIILLGKDVAKYFPKNMIGFNIIKFPHPASLFGNEDTEKYINNVSLIVRIFISSDLSANARFTPVFNSIK